MSGCTQHSRYVRVHTTQSLCQGAHNIVVMSVYTQRTLSRYVRVHTTDTVVMSVYTQQTQSLCQGHTTDTVVMSGCTQLTQSLCQGAHNGHSRYVRVHTTDTVVMSGCTQRTRSLRQGAHNGHSRYVRVHTTDTHTLQRVHRFAVLVELTVQRPVGRDKGPETSLLACLAAPFADIPTVTACVVLLLGYFSLQPPPPPPPPRPLQCHDAVILDWDFCLWYRGFRRVNLFFLF